MAGPGAGSVPLGMLLVALARREQSHSRRITYEINASDDKAMR